jgi:hypothetical protein
LKAYQQWQRAYRCQLSGVNEPDVFGNDVPNPVGNDAPPVFGKDVPGQMFSARMDQSG